MINKIPYFTSWRWHSPCWIERQREFVSTNFDYSTSLR